MPAFTFVDQPDRIAAAFGAESIIGFDTEFMRERTFFSQLCLVQLSTREQIYCVDPLTDSDMSGFWLGIDRCLWVLHSGRQDVEVVYQTAGFMPSSIFDTQVAAALLGFQPQMGYAGLIKELFDVDLAKSHTRANWTTRPLPEEYLQYAAEDVEFLLPAYDELANRLDQVGRLEWARSDSQLLLDATLYDIEPNNAFARLKGARNLRGRRRSAAIELAAWREMEALKRDRPRQWIMRDAVLIDIAYKQPQRVAELSTIPDLPPKLLQRAGEDIVRVVAQISKDHDDYRPPGPPDEEQKSILRKMQALVAECAQDHGLAAETIASKKELSAVIMRGNRDSRVFNGWRKKLIGDALTALL
jgi:ribonuclease D